MKSMQMVAGARTRARNAVLVTRRAAIVTPGLAAQLHAFTWGISVVGVILLVGFLAGWELPP